MSSLQLDNLASFEQTGKFEKALEEFESILSAILKHYGDVHCRVGAALHNVGIANLRAGKLDDAMDALEEAVRIRKLTLGGDDPKVAVSNQSQNDFETSLCPQIRLLYTLQYRTRWLSLGLSCYP